MNAVRPIARALGIVALGLAFALAGASPAAGAPAAGWRRHDLAGGSHCWRYRPKAWDPARASPLILFFHGAGSSAQGWRPFLDEPAEAAGAVVAAVKSRGASWALGVDETSVAACLDALAAEFATGGDPGGPSRLDWGRVGFAGHSAGGAFAYLLALGPAPPVEAAGLALFGASFHPVGALADPGLRPPVAMSYGAADPNRLLALPGLEAQWTRLGIPFSTRILAGAGHTAVPDDVTAGLVELATRRHPAAGACRPDGSTACAAAGRLAIRVERLEPPALLARVRWTSGQAALFGAPRGAAGEAQAEALVRVEDRCLEEGRIGVVATGVAVESLRVRLRDVPTGRERSIDLEPLAPARFLPDAFLGCGG